ncbi:unnamed protein product [Musa acuminata subsp. malaccensis]|uniref:(wild Malaysian banana) hypothetical protein n=1 Tax=Musa acuminata subsp. malaccensis TaxID=214687 RepID=A0A804JFQ7_MUSAM|nr:unnamed protein product [Musa acuminata subsp. malaccensis]
MCRSKIAVNVFFSSPHRRPFCPFPLVVHWRNKLWIRIPLPQILRVCQSRNLRLPWKRATSIAGIQPYR